MPGPNGPPLDKRPVTAQRRQRLPSSQIARSLSRSRMISDVVDNDAAGQLDLAALERAIAPRTRLIAITHLPTQGGPFNPTAEVGGATASSICSMRASRSATSPRCAAGRLSHAVGPGPPVSARVRRDTIGMPEPPFIDLDAASWVDADTYVVRDDARRFENWERPVASQIGLGVAARYAMRVGIEAIEARVKRSVRCCGGSSRSDPVSACTISAWSSVGSSAL